MDDLKHLVMQYKEIIVAVVTGSALIFAAYLRRPPRATHGAKNPAGFFLLLSLGSLLAGGGLLAAEYFQIHLDPDVQLNQLTQDHPGNILCLAGCILVAAGVIWTPINLLRLLLAPKAPPGLATTVAPGQTQPASTGPAT